MKLNLYRPIFNFIFLSKVQIIATLFKISLLVTFIGLSACSNEVGEMPQSSADTADEDVEPDAPEIVKPDPPTFVEISYGVNDSFNVTPTLTIAVPASTQNDDLLIMMVGSDNGATWVTPAGWTLLYNDSYPSADGANFNTYYRIASGEPADYGVVNSAPGTVSAAGWIAVFRGVDTSNPINVQSHDKYYQTDAVVTKTITAPAITTTEHSCLILSISYVDQNTRNPMTFTVPTGFNWLGFQQAGNDWVTSTLSYRLQDLSGDTGSVSTIWSNGRLNSTTTSGVGTILLALQPSG